MYPATSRCRMQPTTFAAADGGGGDSEVGAAADPTADLENNQPVTITALKTSWIKLSQTLFTSQMERN